MSTGRVKQIGRILSTDPTLNRLQDHLSAVLNPVLQNPLLSVTDYRYVEQAGQLVLQYRKSSGTTGASTWTPLATFTSTGESVNGSLTLFNGQVFGALKIAPTITDGETSIGYFRDTAGTDFTKAWVVGQNTGLVGAGQFAFYYSGGGGVVAKFDATGKFSTNVASTGGLTQEAWTAASLAAGFTNFGAPFYSAGYMRDSQGFVHLRGLVTSAAGVAGSSTIFTLPAGYIPASQVRFPVTGETTSSFAVDIATNGVVKVVLAVAAGGLRSLDGITFDPRS